ncbi:glycosyltransferase [Specibacter sp. NPDC057265]|uniref:glycosyltransferase n=1 Tax=Specibacter sp. NPDC057265 TaxID=3346075 RepID=UPI00363D70B9
MSVQFSAPSQLETTYILPLRWSGDEGLAELARYLQQLSGWMHVLVVDGSAQELFGQHAKAFAPPIRHVPPQPRAGANGKVAGVMTGIKLAATELLIIADDDVRYEFSTLGQILELLAAADIVRPQNYFAPLPWHARLDTARTLINRTFGADYPGTFGVRRSAVLATGGYDGNVLFENLELLRTIEAAGGRERQASGLFVRRLPPTTAHFLRQRVRQAYDDFAQPRRLLVELMLLPLLVVVLWRAVKHGKAGALLLALAVPCVLAGLGRCRNRGTEVFAKTAPLWAPLWVFERAVSVWVAVHFRLRGGMPYAGETLYQAANSIRRLRILHGGKIR